MEIKKIFKGQDQQHAPKFFLGIEIGDSLVKTCLWQVHLDKVSVVNLGSFEAWTDEDSLVNGLDASLTQAVKEIEHEPNQVIFGLPESWLEADQIKADKSPLVKKVITSLDLKPIGLVSITQAIIHQLKEDEGVPPSAILLEILPTKVFVNLVSQGKVEQKEEVGRSDDLAKDVQEGLVRMGSVKLPSRFLLLNGSDLENESQQIISYPWQEHFSFLHLPKVKTFPPDYSIKAIALSGGFEAAKAAGEINKNRLLKQSAAPTSAADLGFQIEDKKEKEVEAEGVGKNSESELGNNFTPTINDPLSQPEEHSQAPTVSPSQTSSFRFKFPQFHFKPFRLPQIPKYKKAIIISLIPLLILLTFLPAYYYFFSRSKITIKVKPEQIEKGFPVILANKPQDGILTIPVRFKEITEEIRGEIPTSGETTVGEKAQGQVTIYNKTLEEKTLNKGDILETQNGIKFILKETVKIASKSASLETGTETYGKVENAPIVAVKIGIQGNISANSKLSVANFPRASLESIALSDFSGGSSRTVKAVDQKDVDKLTKKLTQELVEKINDSLKKTDQDMESITLKDPEISKTEFSNEIGEEAATLSLRLTGQAEILTYSRKLFLSNINENLKKEYPGKKFLSSETKINLSEIKPTDKENTYSSVVQVQGFLVPDLDTFSLAQKIKGKTVRSAKQILSTTNNFAGLNIKTWPNIPLLSYFFSFNPNRLEIMVKIAK